MPIERAPRLLIVDDEESVLGLLERILRAAGYDVVVRGDGLDALELAATAKPFDLLVSDLVMPSMDGDELARRLRHQTPRLKVLYVTGRVDRLMAAQTTAGTDDAFLKKPFTQAALCEAVSIVLFGHTRGLRSQAWLCPSCRAVVDYKDYDRALKGTVFMCRTCGSALVIDRKTDQPVAAKKTSD